MGAKKRKRATPRGGISIVGYVLRNERFRCKIRGAPYFSRPRGFRFTLGMSATLSSIMPELGLIVGNWGGPNRVEISGVVPLTMVLSRMEHPVSEIRGSDGSGFQPFYGWVAFPWGVAPGWYDARRWRWDLWFPPLTMVLSRMGHLAASYLMV